MYFILYSVLTVLSYHVVYGDFGYSMVEVPNADYFQPRNLKGDKARAKFLDSVNLNTITKKGKENVEKNVYGINDTDTKPESEEEPEYDSEELLRELMPKKKTTKVVDTIATVAKNSVENKYEYGSKILQSLKNEDSNKYLDLMPKPRNHSNMLSTVSSNSKNTAGPRKSLLGDKLRQSGAQMTPKTKLDTKILESSEAEDSNEYPTKDSNRVPPTVSDVTKNTVGFKKSMLEKLHQSAGALMTPINKFGTKLLESLEVEDSAELSDLINKSKSRNMVTTVPDGPKNTVGLKKSMFDKPRALMAPKLPPAGKPPRMASNGRVPKKSDRPPIPTSKFGAEIVDVKRKLVESNRFNSSTATDFKPAQVVKAQQKGMFLDLEDNPDVAILGDRRDACGRYYLDEMKLLKLKGTSGRINEFYVYPEPMGGGATSKVFYASPRNARDIDGTPIRDCVAIKSVLLDFNKSPAVLEELKKEEDFLMRFRESKSVKHVIHLYEKSVDEDKNRLVFVLELGAHDLMKRLKIMRDQWKEADPSEITEKNVEKKLEKILRQVLEALTELHSRTIHLDLKPDNLLYIEKRDSKGRKSETLKIIDFGGSELIDPVTNKSLEVREVANVCKMRDTIWSDDRYSSPEQNISCYATAENMPQYPVSTKSDIWSVGVMLAEFALMTPYFPEIDPVVVRRSADPRNIYNAVLSINHLHYPVPILQQPKRPYLEYMNKIHDHFPRLYKIIKMCLNFDPRYRPTAQGILNYLDKNCYFFERSKQKLAEDPEKYEAEACDIGVEHLESGEDEEEFFQKMFE